MKVLGVLHRGDKAARERALIADHDGGAQVLWISVDREAEQRELNDRQADDHAECDAVPAQLDELLEDNAPPALNGKKSGKEPIHNGFP